MNSNAMSSGYFLKCKSCGRSMDDEESIWVVNVKWPIKMRFNEAGMSYMTANLDDNLIMQLIDWSEVVCDSCQSTEIEIKALGESEAEEAAAETEEGEEGA